MQTAKGNLAFTLWLGANVSLVRGMKKPIGLKPLDAPLAPTTIAGTDAQRLSGGRCLRISPTSSRRPNTSACFSQSS